MHDKTRKVLQDRIHTIDTRKQKLQADLDNAERFVKSSQANRDGILKEMNNLKQERIKINEDIGKDNGKEL